MIDNLLDENGRGVLTNELQILFTHAGCAPACHVCGKFLEVYKTFRLKPFATQITEKETKKSLNIMICGQCDLDDKLLPYFEFRKACQSLGFEFPEYKKKPTEQFKEKETLYKRIIEKEKSLTGKEVDWNDAFPYLLWSPENKIEYVRGHQLNPHYDLPYFLARDEYTEKIIKFHRKFVQHFDNENYVDYCVRRKIQNDKEHKAYIRSLGKRAGCFVIFEGKKETIIT